MLKNMIFFVPVVTMLFLLEGCVYFTHHEQIMLLERFMANQREIENYLKGHEEFFYKLEDDIKNNRLKKGIAKGEVLFVYGEPILCKDIRKGDSILETCLYRHPTKYFNTDMIYLNFDKDHKLCSWRFIPAFSKP